MAKIISGWKILSSNFTFVNILIKLASYSVYKSRKIYYDTESNTYFNFVYVRNKKKKKKKKKKRLKKLLQCQRKKKDQRWISKIWIIVKYIGT